MKGKIVLCLILCFSLSAACVYAQADNDLTLFEIDRLIRKTEYDEALRQLNIYIKNKPENFDNAQTRIRKIMNARKEYSILAEKLIDLIQNDPGNNKEIYEITAQLEKFEKHPSDQNLQFIADVKKSAEFNYFRALFMEIQTATAASTQSGNYVAAIEKAKEGFWLYRDSFDDRWSENPEIYPAVEALLADLNNQIILYEEKNFLPKTVDVVNEFIKAVNQEQYDLALDRLNAVKVSFQNYNNIRETIAGDCKQMQEIFAKIQQLDSDTSDASFLPFMIRFIYGMDSVPDSGILGAVDKQWNVLAGRMNDAVFTVLTNKYNQYENGISQLYVNNVKQYVALNEKVLDLYNIPNESTVYELKNPYADYYVFCDYVTRLCIEALRITEIYNQVELTAVTQKAILLELGKEGELLSKESRVTQLFENNIKLAGIVGNRESQELSSFEWSKSYDEKEMDNWNGLSERYSQILSDIFTETNLQISVSWEEITDYYKQCSDYFCNNDRNYTLSAEKYNTGFFTKISPEILAQLSSDISLSTKYQDVFNADPDMDFGINYSYPDIAVKITKYTQNQITKDIKTISDYQKLLDNRSRENDLWKNDKEIVSLVEKTNTYLDVQKATLSALNNQNVTLASLAQSKIVASQLAKNEADIRFKEAENALRFENFDTARKKLQDALSKYDESLNNQNDETLRAECDRKLQELGERIAKTENEIVVREVRELKTLAKDAYFNGRFDDAEKYLNQAKNRWAITNVDPDEEITNLLNFVNTAISMKTGREILPSAPQYPEMSQLLNVAYQYFDEGSRLIGAGQKTKGEEYLVLALESIQKLQFVYPLNQEASILTLRINRLQNPEKFKEEFAQKIETAKMMCKSNETRQEGYANLLDYYELEPNYKGLKELLYQVEIDIGIRQKPVDNSGEARARKLVTEAQNIYRTAGNDTKKLQAALEKIDQSLALISDNKTAIALKDEITTKIGGNTSTVLSTEDERLYQLAIQRLQSNNVLGANAIVEQLLKKPSNANSQKIKDLKNKIDARS